MDMKEKALAHERDIRTRLSKEIRKSIYETTIYRDKVDIVPPVKKNRHYSLMASDSVSCLFTCPSDKRIAVLNFASFYKPGGLYLEGATTQEEALCHSSTLYPVISYFKYEYYRVNKELSGNNHLYTNAALYSRDIIFERSGQRRTADVLTIAAPNWTTAKKNGESYGHNKMKLCQRISFINDILAREEVDILVAGAWGCGVFGQDAAMVSMMMLEHIKSVDSIAFAVPDESSYNYWAFKEELERL